MAVAGIETGSFDLGDEDTTNHIINERENEIEKERVSESMCVYVCGVCVSVYVVFMGFLLG